jgi:hypothetical protein
MKQHFDCHCEEAGGGRSNPSFYSPQPNTSKSLALFPILLTSLFSLHLIEITLNCGFYLKIPFWGIINFVEIEHQSPPEKVFWR